MTKPELHPLPINLDTPLDTQFEAGLPELETELTGSVSENPPIMLEAVRQERQRRMYREMPLEDVTDKAREGDTRAFEVLVESTTDEAFGLAYRLTGNASDAQDVVQEAYIRVYKGIGKFRGDSQFSTWLYRIVANCAHTHMGRGKKHRHETMPDKDNLVQADESPERDPQAQIEKTLLRERVNLALHKLPGILREVVVLRDVYDMPHKDIADQLGITETTAKVRLHRARKQLRTLVFPYTDDSPEEL